MYTASKFIVTSDHALVIREELNVTKELDAHNYLRSGIACMPVHLKTLEVAHDEAGCPVWFISSIKLLATLICEHFKHYKMFQACDEVQGESFNTHCPGAHLKMF